jgi:hypothetical protein
MASIPDIAVINSATNLADDELQKIVNACQTQLDRDYAPAWNQTAKLHLVPRGQSLPTDMWWIAMIDNSDVAGALGYHDLTSAGLPIGKVFVETTKAYGDLVSVTTSHEILEMVGDPDINGLVQVGDCNYAWEMCDACEADQYSYEIDGVPVSDFVYPAYFEVTTQRVGPFDFQKRLQGRIPSLLPGGYLAYEQNGVWTQVTADIKMADQRVRLNYKARPLVGSRRHRRMQVRQSRWLMSTAVQA